MSAPNSFRVAIVPRFGIFEVYRDEFGRMTVVGGFELEMLRLLGRWLHLSPQIVIPREEEWGSKMSNGSWTGAMGMLHRNEADMAMGRITYSAYRAEVGWFTFPYDFVNLVFATRLPKLVPSKLHFFHPFDFSLWMAISALIIMMPILLRCLMTSRYSFQSHFFKSVTLFLDQIPNYDEVSGSRDRVLLMSFYVGAFLLGLAYKSLILSFLTIPQKEKGIETIAELAEAIKIGSYKATLLNGSFVLGYLLRSNIKNVQYIGQKISDNNWAIKATDVNVKKAILEDNYAFINPDFFAKTRLSDEAFVSEDSFSLLFNVIFADNNFCCKEALNQFIRRFTTAGLYLKITRDFTFRNKLSSKSLSQEEGALARKLTFSDLSQAFTALSVGLSLSCLLCIIEIIYGYVIYKT